MPQSHSRFCKGQTYYFCAPGCKAAFEKDPEKYLKGEGEHAH